MYLPCHGGFLVISPSANATSDAVGMFDGAPEALITDRLRARYQAPTLDVYEIVNLLISLILLNQITSAQSEKRSRIPLISHFSKMKQLVTCVF